MAGAPPPEAPGWSERRWVRALRAARGRPLGFTLLLLVVAILVKDVEVVRDIRLRAFDAYQDLAPRHRARPWVTIVAIDDRSLQAHGQWPWPRGLVAELVSKILAAEPAALGIDLLMPEPDRLSPSRIAALPGIDPDTRARLVQLPDPDAMLADALRGRPVVVGVAGAESPPKNPDAEPPLLRAPIQSFGGDPARFVRRFPSTLRSIDQIDAAAEGHGLLSADPEAGIVRRLPVLGVVGSADAADPAFLPALSLEVLRIAARAKGFTVRVDRDGVRSITVAGRVVPTDPDGRAWIHFSRALDARFVSAADVLAGRVDRDRLEGRVVLLGATALALGDVQATPVATWHADPRGKREPIRDDRMPGVEIHAQLIENILDGAPLSRPRWARWAEVGALLVTGVVLVGLLPILRIPIAMPVALVLIGALAVAGFPFYRYGRLLIDSVLPAGALAIVFTGMLAVGLTAADSHRRMLRRQLQQEREEAARIAGELEAAAKIQMGILPDPRVVLADEPRLEVWASLEPAREVGGDLYDVFRLDEDRVCLLVGDVTDKGVPASLFMAVSKALCKSAGLRNPTDPGAILGQANAEISRDNPGQLFVTVWTGVLDLRNGRLSHANAGHDAPYLVSSAGGPPTQLGQASGPPLCFLEDFDYDATSIAMRRGDILCVVTDGVTDARNAAGEMYGRERLERLLAELSAAPTAAAVGEAVRDGVGAFSHGVAQADDVTILVLRWNGPEKGKASASGDGVRVSAH